MSLSAGERQKRYSLAHPERVKATKRRYYLKNRDRQIAKTKRWIAANPDKVRDYLDNRRVHKPHLSRTAWLKRRYKMTIADVTALFEKQGRKCAACFSDKPSSKRGWFVDHDHETGRVRGVVCQHCNLGLGHAKDNPSVLRNWIHYLRRTSI